MWTREGEGGSRKKACLSHGWREAGLETCPRGQKRFAETRFLRVNSKMAARISKKKVVNELLNNFWDIFVKKVC